MVTIATNMAGRGTDILLGGNPAGLASEALHKRGLNPAEVDKETYDAALAEAKAQTEAEHVRGRRGRRPAHRRHRAARLPPHRQPAPRPRRPPGRSGLVAVLPLARGRPHEAVRLGAGDRAHGAPRPRGRRRHRIAARLEDHRVGAEPRRGVQLRHPQARRRVRRRHQQAARDDLRRARQGAQQRGPDRDGPGVPRRGARRARRDRARGRRPARVEPRRALEPAPPDGPDRRGHERRRAVGHREPRGHRRPRPRARRCGARGQGGRGRARTTGRWSSGSSCCGRSTRCGSST